MAVMSDRPRHTVEIIQPVSNLRAALTHGRRWGCNALGVLEFALVLAPLLIGAILRDAADAPGTPQGITHTQRLLFPICAFAAALFDYCWRWRNEPDPRWWVKLGSADAGGALTWVPAWILWLLAAALGILALLFTRLGPSPYSQ
jgi:hypothetical protein